jgi:hypothetical protein
MKKRIRVLLQSNDTLQCRYKYQTTVHVFAEVRKPYAILFVFTAEIAMICIENSFA